MLAFNYHLYMLMDVQKFSGCPFYDSHTSEKSDILILLNVLAPIINTCSSPEFGHMVTVHILIYTVSVEK